MLLNYYCYCPCAMELTKTTATTIMQRRRSRRPHPAAARERKKEKPKNYPTMDAPRYRKSFHSRQFVIFDKSLKIELLFFSFFFSFCFICISFNFAHRTGLDVPYSYYIYIYNGNRYQRPCAEPQYIMQKRIENSIASIDVIITLCALMFETGILVEDCWFYVRICSVFVYM